MINRLKHQARPLGILLLIVSAGFLARTYHLNFPSVGYHNMKENEVLSIAQEMQRTGDLLTSRVYFHDGLADDPGKIAAIRPPLVPYQILLSWKLFGQNLWGPRLINVFFGCASILIVYALGVVLSGSAQAGLWAALFLAVLPLSVFFSRNLQAESPAFFFMLLGSLFYARYLRFYKKYNLVIGSLAFLAAWAYKGNFLIGALPFTVYIPWRQLRRERADFWQAFAAASWVYALILGYSFLRTGRLLPAQFTGSFLTVFHPAYWREYGQALWWYTMGENFTFFFLLLAVCGVLLAFLKERQRVRRFIAGWCLAAPVYGMLYPVEVSQNSFFQMPFLVPLCVAATYAVCYGVEEVSRLMKRGAVIAVAVVILAFTLPHAYQRLERLYGTLFMGVDAAGESIKEFTRPDERVFLYTYAQGYGIARYAHRYVGSPATLEEFQDKERRFGVRILCFYPGEYFHSFRAQEPELYRYIDQNYTLKELGLMEHPDRLGYVILERGKPERPLEDVLSKVAGKKLPGAIYDVAGNFHFFYTLRPVDDETLQELQDQTGNSPVQ